MQKVKIFLIAFLALAPACALPLVTMDKYLELKKQYDDTVVINNDNVDLCVQIYEKLKVCVDTLEQCMQVAIPDYVPPEQPKTQEL